MACHLALREAPSFQYVTVFASSMDGVPETVFMATWVPSYAHLAVSRILPILLRRPKRTRKPCCHTYWRHQTYLSSPCPDPCPAVFCGSSESHLLVYEVRHALALPPYRAVRETCGEYSRRRRNKYFRRRVCIPKTCKVAREHV